MCRGEAEAFRVVDKAGRCEMASRNEVVTELCEEVHGAQPRPRQGEEVGLGLCC